MIKFFLACAILGSSLAYMYEGIVHTHGGYFLAGASMFGFLVGHYVGKWINRKRILPHHDPNIPFTSEELREIGMGIIYLSPETREE